MCVYCCGNQRIKATVADGEECGRREEENWVITLYVIFAVYIAFILYF